jgi:hypothetical protein
VLLIIDSSKCIFPIAMGVLLTLLLLATLWQDSLTQPQRCPSLFQEQALERQNEYRAMHRSPPLKLDAALSDYAQEWAETMARQSESPELTTFHSPSLLLSETLSHRANPLYGESLYKVTGYPHPKPSGQAVIDELYSRGAQTYFDNGGGAGREPTEHDMAHFGDWSQFTQMVWRTSQVVGVGCTWRGASFYVVLNYDPAGNVPEQFGANV